MYLAEYIKEKLSLEEYSFSTDELQTVTHKEKEALTTDLSYLTKKGAILPLRRGFYLIIPPRYSKQGKLPIQLYIENLFKNLKRPYYIGLYAAAKFHGASHQQIQRDYIITTKPTLLDIHKGNTDVRFFTTANWPKKNILHKKSDAGTFKISDPILTALDLIHYQNKLGGLNRMLSVIEEIVEEMNTSDLQDLLTWYSNKSSLQRFGYILERLEADSSLLEMLFEYFKSVKYYPVLLSPKTKQKAGAVLNEWKVDVNIKLESDI